MAERPRWLNLSERAVADVLEQKKLQLLEVLVGETLVTGIKVSQKSCLVEFRGTFVCLISWDSACSSAKQLKGCIYVTVSHSMPYELGRACQVLPSRKAKTAYLKDILQLNLVLLKDSAFLQRGK